MNNDFPTNPRVTSDYRKISIEWDDVKHFNESIEEKIYQIETEIRSEQTKFLKFRDRSRVFFSTEPKITFNNLLVKTQLKVNIALKGRRNNDYFEVSPYIYPETKSTEPVEVGM